MTTLDDRPATGTGGNPEPAAPGEVSLDTSPEQYRLGRPHLQRSGVTR